ncbi:MAG TPA: universal stress protein [Longimicrobium sp.]|jgi:nucleotide-binding universal stress UspA family protein
MKIKKLVTGVGTLREPDAVLPAAAALAGRAGLPLEVVHAFDVSDPFVDTYLRTTTIPGDPLRHFAEGLQARLEGQVGGLAGHGEVQCRAEPGAAPTILHEATCGGDCLLVVGPTRRGRAGAALLGTTAQRVLHGARTPVLVLHGELPPCPRVLFCVDLGSPGAARMVEEGLAVVGALCPEPPVARALLVVGLEMDLPIPGLHDRLAGTARERLDTFLAELGQRMEPRIRTGAPAREAVAEAAEWPADLVVVGSHGRSDMARALLGSVAEAVVRDAHCSVLVIPPL